MAQKAKPLALRVLDGTMFAGKFNANEPKPAVGVPEPPPHLNGHSLAEWHRLAPMLADAGVLTVVDEAVLAVYCSAHALSIAIERELAMFTEA